MCCTRGNLSLIVCRSSKMIARRYRVWFAAAILVACLSGAPLQAGDNPACGAFGSGSCSMPNETPGCELESCCNAVCDVDPFCCEGSWDDQCVATATEICGIFVNCPSDGSCYEAQGQPGCGDQSCCMNVCESEPACCDTEWTQDCADLAFDVCPCGAPGAGDCFEAHDGSGCADQECCRTVCRVDGVCCSGFWDDICVSEALKFCGALPCEVQCPAEGVQEPELCGELLNEGCNSQITDLPEPPPPFTAITCGEVICGTAFGAGTRDTDWYEVTATEPTQLSWTVSSEFPSAVIIIEGTCDTQFGIIADAYGTDCAEQSAATCVQPGTYYLFVSTATEERTLRSGAPCPDPEDPVEGLWGINYVASLTCAPCTAGCQADLTADGVVDASDLGQVLGAWGPNPGHPADFNGDGVIGPFDLAVILAAWGPC